MKSSAPRSDKKTRWRQHHGVLRWIRRSSELTVHLTLVCLLQMVAGEGWAEELQRGELVRKDHGEPSVFSTIADNVIEVSRSAWERGSETFESWAQSSWVSPSAEEPTSGRSTLLADVGPNGHVPAPLADVGAQGRAPAPRGNVERKKARAIPPLPQPPSGFAPLSPGFGTPPWRLLSVPDEPANVDPADVLSTIAADFTLAYAYDACDPVSPWRVYDPADLPGSDLTAVDHRIGFWLKGTDPDPLAVAGTEPAETSIRLCPGWNLIGYPLAQDRPVLAALSSIIGKFLRVYGFDPDDEVEPWKVYDVDVPDWANTLRVMERGRGYWIYAVEETALVMRNVGPPPEVDITSPQDGDVVTFLTDVEGTVQSDLLESWELTYRLHGEESFVSFASGDTPVLSDVLGTFDPTLLLNGLYELKLDAADFTGQSSSVTVEVVVEGRAKIGNFTISYVDLEVPVAGLPIQVIRTYDSRDKRTGDFGVGWKLELSDVRLQENRAPGEDWQGTRTGLVIPVYCIRPTEEHIVTVTLTDDSVLRFVPTPNPECQPAVPPQAVDITYEPLLGTQGNLRPLDQSDQALVVGSFPGPVQLWDLKTTQPHNPALYELALPDGRALVVDQDGGLVSIEDLNGNKLTVGHDGITHSSGKGITFERDGQDRIHRVVDPLGNVLTYDYDVAGDLIAFADRTDATSRYSYDDRHGLLDIQDPRDVTPLRNDYDDDGRLVRHTDAFGKTIEFSHQIGNRQELITNRLGLSRLLEYDPSGNVVREVNEAGHEIQRTFDARHNILSETDPFGNTTSYTYDSSDRLLSLTDPPGNKTSFTYNPWGQFLTQTDARGSNTTNTYDGRGNLTSTTDPLGNTTILTYDSRGNLLSETDPEGAVTRFEYDGFGNLIRETDANGSVTTYTYDANGNRLTQTTTRTTPNGTETLVTRFAYDEEGRLTETIHPDGFTSHTLYDPTGQVRELVDKLGRSSTFTYDAAGRRTTTTQPDGTSEQVVYDAEGRRLSQTDRGGRTTFYEYDALGHLARTIFPDGATRTTVHDAAGKLISSTDARGNVTLFEHDAAGRRTKIIDALGHATLFSYDAVGNPLTVTDARGYTTSFEYDAADHLIRTVFPDGTFTAVSYDGAGRPATETDQGGRITRFAYDGMGQLISVTDALGQVTSFTYDEQGNRVTQTDANGHTTRFEYDSFGRQTRRIFPGGAAESFTYDAEGNQLSRTDFNGALTTYVYDIDDRLLRRTYMDGSSVSFTYSATGQRLSASDARGVTSYAYDERDRITSLTYPNGRSLSYEYDLEGNRTAFTADIGGVILTTTYTYDALNRLSTVVDPQGQIYVHAYDENGNRTAVTYPNGVATTYTYDALNRLRDLTTATQVGTVIASFAYTLGPTGRRTRIDEHEGTRRDYTYDALYRLTDESVSRAGEALFQNTFTYDPVGNRLGQGKTQGENPAQTISYTYDTRDRLLTEDGIHRAWDENGNLVSRSGSAGATYAWDFENRLIRVDLADGSAIEHEYDPDGVRLRTRVTPSTGPPQVTNYLVDPWHTLSSVGRGRVLSQVVAEVDENGILTAYHVRGDDLLATLRLSGIRFFHADGLGSIRALTDDSGTVTDRYSFDAFGAVTDHQGTDPNAYLFAGEQRDPNSGFYYLRARWLSVSQGRFLSQDPFAGLIGEPVSLHRYLYARADVPNVVDPSGRFSLGQAMIVGAIIGALLGGIIGAIYGKSQTGTVLSLGSLKYILAGIVGGAAAGAMIGAAFYLAPAGLWPIVRTGFTQLIRKLANPLGHRKTKFALLSGFALGLGAGLLDPDLAVSITAGVSTASTIVNDILVRGAIWKRHAIGRVVGPLFVQHARTILFPYVQSTTFIALAFSFGFVAGYTSGAAIRHGYDLLTMN